MQTLLSRMLEAHDELLASLTKAAHAYTIFCQRLRFFRAWRPGRNHIYQMLTSLWKTITSELTLV